ncbi:MAG TPA: YutD-like domain-containing protein [Massilibacterium sp.]|nr:YutD-like domain-containing protein [Massilibacterium sp.]
MVQVGNQYYELIENVKDGYNEEAFLERYSEILNKYDFIVGDWGYSQLRLRGFYDDRNNRSTYDTKISTLEEYVYEYCNFGCSYFVLKKVVKQKENPSSEG